MREWINSPHVGDARALMREMLIDIPGQVQCIVTSPPYWGGLRDYGMKGQFGLEPKPALHVQRMVSTFRLARELLRPDGTLWLNYGDSYMHSGGRGSQGKGERQFRRQPKVRSAIRYSKARTGLKPKDLVGMPWRVALALQADGWYLRSCIIWHKSNPMPESTKDRPTNAHEYIFLFSKRPKYYYDAAAVREPVSADTHARMARNATAAGSTRANGGSRPDRPMKAVLRQQPVAGWDAGPGAHSTIEHAQGPKDIERAALGLRDSTKFGRGAGFRKQDGHGRRHEGFNERYFGNVKSNDSFNAAMAEMPDDRNMRSVWTFPTEAFKGAHFATFPRALVRRCVLAGTRAGDVVLDPFLGSGTVAEVAVDLGRRFVGLEINPKYVELYRRHRGSQIGLKI